MPCALSSADRTLAAKLEKAEAADGATMTRALRDYLPEASSEPFGGGVAVFAGVGSPMTHVLGLGLSGSMPAVELESMERFYSARGSACLIDLCPLADASVLEFVARRPYRLIEFNGVLARRIGPDEALRARAG